MQRPSAAIVKDLAVISVGALLALVAALRFEAVENFERWSQRYEAWQLDELVVLPLVLALALGVFYWRRWGELRREAADREGAEEALRRSERSLATAQRVAHVGSWEYDVEEDRLRWSDELYRIYGFAPGRFVPTREHLLEIVHPEDRGLVEWSLREAFCSREQRAVECRIVRPDGEVRTVQNHGETYFDGEGKPKRLTGTVQDVTGRKALEERLSYRASHDLLTGLPNRALLSERLDHALDRAARDGKTVAVLFLDLDNFKYVNDSLGHEAGDRLLVSVARRLAGAVRTGDTVARLGGDEFVVLLEDDVEGAEDAARSARRISGALRAPVVLEGQKVSVDASVGIALGDAGAGAAELLRDADAAMYRAKAEGKGGHKLFEPGMKEAAREHLRIESDLRLALERGGEGFVVYYQPKVELKTGRIVGMEALMRWEHPERGLLPPDGFLPLAEKTGLIVPIGRWVLKEACGQVKRWHEAHPDEPPLIVCVNLSAEQLRRPGLVGEVEEILCETGMDPEALELEITETAVIEDAPLTLTTLHKLKGLGAKLAVDDFGTGYSSLSYLKNFPIDFIKIDRSITEGLERDPRNTAITSAAITLAHALGEQVIAEGVETAEQLGLLRRLGCDIAQGYYLGEPVPGDAAAVLYSEALEAGPRWAPVRPNRREG